MSITTAGAFVDNKLALYAMDLDTDGDTSNTCYGTEKGVAVGWSTVAQSLVAAIVQFYPDCSSSFIASLPFSRRDSHSIAVSFASWRVGATTFNWGQLVTGVFNPTSDAEFDLLPAHGWKTALPTASPSFRDGTAPTIHGTYSQILPGDFNGDGYSDVFFYGTGTAADAMWLGTAGGGHTSKAVTINGAYTIAPGDFNGDGRTDLLLYRPGTGQDYLWYGNANGTFTQFVATINGAYSIVPGDFNGDGFGDLLLYRPGTGQDYVWFGTAFPIFSQQPATINGTYVITSGDFNGDS